MKNAVDQSLGLVALHMCQNATARRWYVTIKKVTSFIQIYQDLGQVDLVAERPTSAQTVWTVFDASHDL